MRQAKLEDGDIGVIIYGLEHFYDPTTRELQSCGPETRALWFTRDHHVLKEGVLFYV